MKCFMTNDAKFAKKHYQDFKDYNKRMRQLGAKEKTWKEFVDIS